MKKLIAAFCCLLFAASFASAQGTNPGYKAPPLSKSEQDERNKKPQSQMGDCSKKMKDGGIKPDHPDFNRLMGNCLKG